MNSSPRENIGLTLSGAVLEIGPGNRPFTVGPNASVIYADRSVNGGRDVNWPELVGAPAGVQADHDLDLDAEGLTKIGTSALDGVIASHVIEHVANPLAVMKEFARVLRSGGKLLLVVPDRHRTFDAPRAPTPFSTVLAKFRDRVAQVDEETIREFCEAIFSQPSIHPPQVRDWHDPSKLDVERIALHRRRSIHVHCWSPEEFAALVVAAMVAGIGSWQLLEMYVADHFPDGRADEFALLMEHSPELDGAEAARRFVTKWSEIAAADNHVASARLAQFEVALARDICYQNLRTFTKPSQLLDAQCRQLGIERDEALLEVASLQGRLRAMQSAAAADAVSLAEQSDRANAAESRVLAIENSNSWKVTAPIRALSRMLRG